jgi:hypothetical protein
VAVARLVPLGSGQGQGLGWTQGRGMLWLLVRKVVGMSVRKQGRGRLLNGGSLAGTVPRCLRRTALLSCG